MRTCLLASLLLSGAIAVRAADPPAAETPPPALAVEALRSPFVMIGESVSVSVGRHVSIVESRSDFKYVRRLERDGAAERCTFEYPVCVPKDVDSLADAIAVTQPRLHVGSVDYEPEDIGWSPESDERPRFLPEDAQILYLIFRLPRAILRDRLTLNLRYFQPHYRFAGREVSAWLPLLPDFEAFKNEFLYSRSDFTVEFEAVDPVRLHRLSSNEAVAQDSPTRVKLNPVHREFIAIEVLEPPAGPAGGGHP
ncbi:MAG TPA: hypothetical protein VLT83_02225 [Opitutaceae bacterium]|nr:hypothetical protein [Opitutaceae bacterium]